MIIEEHEKIKKEENNHTQKRDQILIVNNQIQPHKDEAWETDEGSDKFEFYRLKLENVKKIKNDLSKHMRNKPIKYKKIDEEIFEKLRIRDKYFKNKVYPFIEFKDKLYEEDENLNKIILNGDTYNVDKKVEIGSALIFEINPNNDLNFLGVSKEFYDASTKIHYLPAGTLNLKTNTIVSRKRKKKPKIVSDKEMALKKEVSEGNNKSKKKKKKKRLVKHKKNSTIIEIKKIK